MPDYRSRLLIVDDNKVNRLLLSRHIDLLGHRFELAENVRMFCKTMIMLETGLLKIMAGLREVIPPLTKYDMFFGNVVRLGSAFGHQADVCHVWSD